MSRRRAIDPAERISFSMPRSLIMRLDSKLSYNASRSAWIKKAIRDRMKHDEEGVDIIGTIDAHELVKELVFRATMEDLPLSKSQKAVLHDIAQITRKMSETGKISEAKK
tara:strand:- start:533 stop:862 length:330 start_codon:yes stop_codon:yes gene_type:complete